MTDDFLRTKRGPAPHRGFGGPVASVLGTAPAADPGSAPGQARGRCPALAPGGTVAVGPRWCFWRGGGCSFNPEAAAAGPADDGGREPGMAAGRSSPRRHSGVESLPPPGARDSVAEGRTGGLSSRPVRLVGSSEIENPIGGTGDGVKQGNLIAILAVGVLLE